MLFFSFTPFSIMITRTKKKKNHAKKLFRPTGVMSDVTLTNMKEQQNQSRLKLDHVPMEILFSNMFWLMYF